MKNTLLVLGLTTSVALAQIVAFTPAEVSHPSEPASQPSARYGKARRAAQQEVAPLQDEANLDAAPPQAPPSEAESLPVSNEPIAPSIDTLADDPDAAMSQSPTGTLSATPAVIHRQDGTSSAANQVLPPVAKYQPANSPAAPTIKPVAPATVPASAAVTVAPSRPAVAATATAPASEELPKQEVAVRPVTDQSQLPVASNPAAIPPAKPHPIVAVSESDKILFQLKDLAMLNRAARMAGGSLRVSIQPVGIQVKDLVGPLKQMGYFDIGQDSSNRFVIRTRQQDPVTAKLQNQIQKLRSESLRLLDEIHSLEKTRSAMVSAPAASGGVPASYSGQGEPLRLRQNEEAPPQATPVVLQPKLQ